MKWKWHEMKWNEFKWNRGASLHHMVLPSDNFGCELEP